LWLKFESAVTFTASIGDAMTNRIRCEGCEADYALPDDDANFCAACRERWDETELHADEPNPWHQPQALHS
jgi:rRNA maturation endonuclease Nob1